MHRIFGRLGIVAMVALSMLGAGAASAAEPVAATMHRGLPAPSRPAPDQFGIPYGTRPDQLLDVRLPDPDVDADPRPVIVYVHAGGWISGDRTAVPDVTLAQVARGYAVVSIDYELATTDPRGLPRASFPGAVWDVKRAVRFVKAHASSWNIDPARVILMGGSAGGYLASFVGATTGRFEPPELTVTKNPLRDSSVSAIVDFVGPTDLKTFERTDHPWAAPLEASFLGCEPPSETTPITCPDDTARDASVAPYVDASDPPIFLAYGAVDALVVAGTQGAPVARVWVAAHHGDPSSAVYDVVAGAGHNLPFDQTLNPLDAFLDQVSV